MTDTSLRSRTGFTPAQLNRLDTARLAAYKTNLDFYNGSQWQQTSRNRQLVFNYTKVSVDKLTSFLMQGLGIACYPSQETDELKARVSKAEQVLYHVYDDNHLQQLDYETEIDTAILGDGCYKVIWDTDHKRIRITAPDVSGIFAWWLGDDTSTVWRVASRYTLTEDEIAILYGQTGNTLRKYYSHDYGQSWDNAQLSTYQEVVSMAACWWGTGDNVVCLALRATYPAYLARIVLDTSDQTTDEDEWYDSNHPLLSTTGIGATYNAALQQCEIVLAGKESDSPYNHHDLFRTKLSNTYAFLGLESFLMAPDGEDITYEYPDCHLPSPLTGEGEGEGEGVPDYETNRITAVEKFAGVTAYTRPITCHVVKGTFWTDTTFTEPRPLMDIAPAYGLRTASTADYWWMETPSGVWRAPRPAASPVDLTSHILSMEQHVIARPSAEGRGNLVLVLDNSSGYFATPGEAALACLRFRSELQLRLGYKTTNGSEAAPAGTYWIDAWEYSPSPNQSTFTITALDGWGLMSRWSARYHMRWNKDDVNPKSVWQILYQVLARAGIRLSNTPAKPQSSAINNLYPDFALAPGTQGTQALNRLLSFVPDRLVMRGQEAFIKDLLANEASSYSYGTDHPITAGRYAHQVTPSRSRALGQEGDGDRILQDALDWDLLELAIDDLEQAYDPNLQTATRTQERADALLRAGSLRAKRGNLVVPTNCGQRLLDVVEVTDHRCGIDQDNHRVQAIRTLYDRRKAQYEQALTLGAP